MSEFTTNGPVVQQARALRARLELVFPPAQFGHGYVPATLTKPVWERMTKRLPFVGLQWLGFSPDASSGRRLQMRADWNILLVAQNAAGPEARLLGDARGPGIASMASVACLAVHSFTLPDLGTFLVGKADALLSPDWADEAVAAAGVSASILSALADPAVVDDLAAFITANITWTFPGLDPAAGDIVILEGA